MISDFCRVQLVNVLEESERNAVCQYLIDLLELLTFPPYRGRWIDWTQVAIAAGIEKERLQAARHRLQPVFDAVSRAVAMQDNAPALRTPPEDVLSADKPPARTVRSRRTSSSAEAPMPRKRGPKPKVIVEYPDPRGQSGRSRRPCPRPSTSRCGATAIVCATCSSRWMRMAMPRTSEP